MRKNPGKCLTTVAIAGAAVSGLLIFGSPASAAEHALTATAHVAGVKVVPAAGSGKGHICLKSSSSYCLQSNGVGNQVTITNDSSKYAVFTISEWVSSGGKVSYQWQNASGNCLRTGNGYTVTIKDGSCSLTDPADWWDAQDGYLRDQYYHDYMLVRGQPKTGNKVFDYATVASGDWAKWSVPARQ
jgi:hypothetical protein